MRGKADPVLPADLARRITPACAGKRNRAKELVEKYKDHPRVCGEKSSFDLLARHISGSPPRVRGKVSVFPYFHRLSRITPACAGKSANPQGEKGEPKDHPRVCGEKVNIIFKIENNQGSPPRVRGKVLSAVLVVWMLGITPACAGKRPIGVDNRLKIWDHPRVCGEKTKKSP